MTRKCVKYYYALIPWQEFNQCLIKMENEIVRGKGIRSPHKQKNHSRKGLGVLDEGTASWCKK